jgi:excisionase family DNA binding protein
MDDRPETEQRLTYTVDEYSKKLGISRNACYVAIKAKEIPSIRIGGRILIPRGRGDRLLQGEQS